MRAAVASAFALALIAAAFTAGGASAAACGDIAGRLLYEIETNRVPCTAGRRVARQWASQCAQLRTGSCLVTALFYCRYRNTGYESGAIRCVHDSDLRKPLRTQRRVVFVTAS